MGGYLGSYATLGVLILAAAALFFVAFSANRLFRPGGQGAPHGSAQHGSAQHASAKYETYECGVDPVGGDWVQVQIRYYLYAYLYVLFAVESVFLFPWAVIYTLPGFGRAAVVEMAIFLGVLGLGLLYAWRKGVLRWA